MASSGEEGVFSLFAVCFEPLTSTAALYQNPNTAVDSLSDGPILSISSPPRTSLTPSFLDQIRGFSSGTLAPGHEMGLISDLPATVNAIKNLSSKIVYDEHNHERYPPGDPSKLAFAYFFFDGRQVCLCFTGSSPGT
ncbi:Ubiquinol-Cytochrome [Forsythia ovata]|uniref:Ubiquinol-Cytochrome n=1 Tax=Forsythia ovata TaxID=205694 RepID=A0ABD1WCG0_9LAMI